MYAVQRAWHGHDRQGNSRHSVTLCRIVEDRTSTPRGRVTARRWALPVVVMIGDEASADSLVSATVYAGAIELPRLRSDARELRELREQLTEQRRTPGASRSCAFLHGHEVPDVGQVLARFVERANARAAQLSRAAVR